MTADRLTLLEVSATATFLIDCITLPEVMLLWKYAEHHLINIISTYKIETFACFQPN